MIRSQDDLKKALNIQLRALRASCETYDRGEAWEAARMAVAVHTLVHDAGKKNISILTQLKLRESFKYVASETDLNPKNLVASTPLVMLQIGPDDVKYVPCLGDGHLPVRRISFHDWWARDVIFQSGANDAPFLTLSRRRLVFALRNKEGGGAHYDPEISDEAYITFSQKPLWFARTGENEYPILQLELANMRQVAWELLETLKENGIEP